MSATTPRIWLGLTLHHLSVTKARRPRQPPYLPATTTPTEYVR